MCNCFEKNEVKIKEKYECDRVIDNNVAWSFEGETLRYSTYEAEKEIVFKSGKTRKRKEKVNILWKFCPYCGESLE